MDKPSWATPLSAVVFLAVGAVAMVGAAFFAGSDAAGRFLMGLAALALAVLALLAGVQRPRLTLDGDELVVKSLRGVRSYNRADIERVRIVPYPRMGRRVPMLEIDIEAPEERLIIFGRWDLGEDPRGVFDVLDARGFVPDEFSER
ncbi:PH domain-containing protein [Actinomycetes bacterium M1A6_2h]